MWDEVMDMISPALGVCCGMGLGVLLGTVRKSVLLASRDTGVKKERSLEDV